MNVQDYIKSGAIESYVMGLSSEAERAEFEHLCSQNPELVAARKDFEVKLEEYASDQAVPPPQAVKAKILEAIGNMKAPVISSSSSKVITMDNGRRPATGTGWLRFVAAASVVLVVTMAFLYYQSNKLNKDLANTNDRLKEKLDSTDSLLDKIVKEDRIVKDPNTTVVNMVGTIAAPKSSANIYWDSTSANVFLVVKNMPKLPSSQQYQLWALIDGKPKDLGVFDATDDKVILKMKNTRKAQAFAITIEKKGGSTVPNLPKMQAIGKTI